jgi:RNA polymerase sigma-70 factor (ECF subfamily)
LTSHRPFLEQITDHVPALRRYARVLRRQRDQAEDLEQDCIERALAKAHQYQPDTNLRAWLFTIMRNIAVTQARRAAFQHRAALYFGARTLDTVAASQDLVVELNECIALTKCLSVFERRIIRHVCLDDLSYDETAQRLGKPIGTIKSRFSRARQTLRNAVDGPANDEGAPVRRAA